MAALDTPRKRGRSTETGVAVGVIGFRDGRHCRGCRHLRWRGLPHRNRWRRRHRPGSSKCAPGCHRGECDKRRCLLSLQWGRPSWRAWVPRHVTSTNGYVMCIFIRHFMAMADRLIAIVGVMISAHFSITTLVASSSVFTHIHLDLYVYVLHSSSCFV